MYLQKTLKSSINCTGIGLHTGANVQMVLRPAAPDTGIVFRRTDLAGQPEIAASFDCVTERALCTTIGKADGAVAMTIEHLMAAFAGLGVDNVVVELDGPEVPAMDGSAAPFVFLIDCAGLIEQAAPRRYIEVLKPVTVHAGAASASLMPGRGFSLGFAIDFDNPLVATQDFDFRLSEDGFRAELAGARTFGFLEDVAKLQSLGLARGGSLENAVVVDGDRVLNEDGLRFDDEFVRHKALDALGDLRLAGGPILGRYVGERSSHALNNRLVAEFLADTSAWRITELRPARARSRGRAVRPARTAAAATA